MRPPLLPHQKEILHVIIRNARSLGYTYVEAVSYLKLLDKYQAQVFGTPQMSVTDFSTFCAHLYAHWDRTDFADRYMACPTCNRRFR